MNRFEEQRDILDHGKFFKVVCGAGNEDLDEVKALSTLYTLVGALIISCTVSLQFVN